MNTEPEAYDVDNVGGGGVATSRAVALAATACFFLFAVGSGISKYIHKQSVWPGYASGGG